MSKKYEKIKDYRALGWFGKVVLIIGLVISLGIFGCGRSATKTEENIENPSKQVQAESSKEKSSTESKPTASSQESAYAEAISQQTSRWSTIVDNLGSLIENPRIDDKSWSEQVKAQVEQMKSLADLANKLTPPDKYKDVHAAYMKAVTEFSWVADNLTNAIDNLDTNLLSQCSQRLDNGSSDITDVGKAMDKLSGESQ